VNILALSAFKKNQGIIKNLGLVFIAPLNELLPNFLIIISFLTKQITLSLVPMFKKKKKHKKKKRKLGKFIYK